MSGMFKPRTACVGARLGALALAALLAACAAPGGAPRGEVGRYKLALPPVHDPVESDWVELTPGDGFQLSPAVAGAQNVAGLRTRAWGLRGPGSRWQALVLLHVGDVSRNPIPWNRVCPPVRGVVVDDAAGGSPTRIDCLRYRRWAEYEDWLPTQRPDLLAWGRRVGVDLPAPTAHLSHVLTTGWGDYVALDVLARQDLVRPRTQSNDEFLRAGLPARDWSEQVAHALRTSTAMMDGLLALPPFPFSPPPP